MPPRPSYELHWPGKTRPPEAAPRPLHHTDAYPGGSGDPSLPPNRLLWGDNLPLMQALLPDLRGRIDLVYLDPPFDAGHDFHADVPLPDGTTATLRAYRDVWGEGADSYLQTLYERLWFVRELLAETGSLIVHVNWRVGHLVQALLDEVFGPGERRGPGQPGFRNEIVWGYGGGGAARNTYRRKHDNLFWYTRSGGWTFNPQYRPYTEGTRQRGLTTVKGPKYALRDEGATLETWWTGPEVQKILSPTARENWKFPTQKPEALLERIIQGHSNPGDRVADFFCGSGTTGVVAQRLGRRWVMADKNRMAMHVTRKRLACLRGAASSEERMPFDLYRLEPEPVQGVLEAEAVYHPDRTMDVRLTGFTPALSPELEALPPALRQGGLDLLDSWSVDFSFTPYADRAFTHQWSAARRPGDRSLPLQSDARHPCFAAGAQCIAVKATDLFGYEAFGLVTLALS